MTPDPHAPYAPPATAIVESLPEETGWADFPATRRVGIAGSAVGFATCVASVVHVTYSAAQQSAPGPVPFWPLVFLSVLLTLYAATLASLWPARHVRWLRLVVTVLQVPMGLLAAVISFGLAMFCLTAPAAEVSAMFDRPAWLMIGATCVPPLAFWIACIAAGHQWWRVRDEPAKQTPP